MLKYPRGMGKRKQSRKVCGESAHYWPELMLPFPLAAACITTARTWA